MNVVTHREIADGLGRCLITAGTSAVMSGKTYRSCLLALFLASAGSPVLMVVGNVSNKKRVVDILKHLACNIQVTTSDGGVFIRLNNAGFIKLVMNADDAAGVDGKGIQALITVCDMQYTGEP